jgi:hypothetical protein
MRAKLEYRATTLKFSHDKEEVMCRSRGVFSSSLLAALFSILSLSPFAFGQSGSTAASITGNIIDEQGAIIPGIPITARNIETNLTRETKSGEDGTFLISQLPPGTYDVTVSAESFTTKTSRLELVLGTTTLLNFTMSIGANSEVIEVKAINTIGEGKTESSTNNSRDRIENLPINRRDYMEFSLTVARVVKDGLPQQGVAATSGLSFNGQSSRQNNITIDGLDNNDPFTGSVRVTFGQDAVQEFQVVSDSYSAEFGRALGGVVNIVTRGGGNNYHGDLFFLDRDDKISARDVFAPFKPNYKQYQFGSTFGGPIKKDRIFFFTSFERLTVKQNNFVTISDESVSAANRQGFPLRNGPVPFALGTTSILTRLDMRLGPSNTLYLRYNFGGTYNGAFEPFGGLIGGTSAGIQRLDDSSFVASNTYISTGLNLVNETRLLFSKRRQGVLTSDPGPQVQLVAPEGQITFGRGTFLPQFRLQNLYQFVNNVTLPRGRHQIKFGIDYLYNNSPARDTNLQFFDNGQGIFAPINFAAILGNPSFPSFTGLQSFDSNLRTPEQRAFLTQLAGVLPNVVQGFPKNLPLADLSLPLAYLQLFSDSRLTSRVQLFSAFFQNDIKLRPNLLVKAGVRYDLARAVFFPDNNGNLSPRLAISYNPAWLSKLRLRASYGLFFGTPQLGVASAINNTTGPNKILVLPFPFSILPFALPKRHFPAATSLPPDVPFIPQLSLSFRFQQDLRNSYTQQISAGFDYFLGENTAVSATYDFVRGIKIFSIYNINPITRPIPGDPIGSAISGRPDPTRGNFFEMASAFDSNYHAVTLSINRRFANRFGLLAHYTFSKAIDNFIDIRVDFQEVNDPRRLDLERGLSLQDVRSRFVLSGTWDLTYTKNPFLRDFQLSTIINLNTGRPYNLLAGVDLNMDGDNPPGDRPAGIGRNVGLMPGFANIDLRLTRTLAINERFRLQGFIEVFNLFNRVNISEVSRFFPPDANGNFNLPPKDGSRFIAEPKQFRSAFAPRQFQFGFRLTY